MRFILISVSRIFGLTKKQDIFGPINETKWLEIGAGAWAWV